MPSLTYNKSDDRGQDISSGYTSKIYGKLNPKSKGLNINGDIMKDC